MRRAGTTVHFATAESYPRFLLRRADVHVTINAGAAAGEYAIAARDVTSDPAIVGRPTLFVVRRAARGTSMDSVRITGSMDHTGATPREIVNLQAAGVALPALSIPSLPFSLDPGRGSSEMRFALDGDRISGRWTVKSASVAWSPDSARTRKLNSLETLVARVLTGINQLDFTADVSGTLVAPRLAVRSNLDRQVADRLRSVVGDEVKSAETKMRAQVDRYVDEKSAPVKARVAEVRAESDRRVADARAKLDEQKRKLDERLKALTGATIGLPRIPGE